MHCEGHIQVRPANIFRISGSMGWALSVEEESQKGCEKKYRWALRIINASFDGANSSYVSMTTAGETTGDPGRLPV